jgi:hypothetical protein
MAAAPLKGLAAASPVRRAAAQLRRMQRHVHESVLMVSTGQFPAPASHRVDITGMLPVGFPVSWNMRRAARWSSPRPGRLKPLATFLGQRDVEFHKK